MINIMYGMGDHTHLNHFNCCNLEPWNATWLNLMNRLMSWNNIMLFQFFFMSTKSINFFLIWIKFVENILSHHVHLFIK